MRRALPMPQLEHGRIGAAPCCFFTGDTGDTGDNSASASFRASPVGKKLPGTTGDAHRNRNRGALPSVPGDTSGTAHRDRNGGAGTLPRSDPAFSGVTWAQPCGIPAVSGAPLRRAVTARSAPICEAEAILSPAQNSRRTGPELRPNLRPDCRRVAGQRKAPLRDAAGLCSAVPYLSRPARVPVLAATPVTRTLVAARVRCGL